jgi:hypothetical protein
MVLGRAAGCRLIEVRLSVFLKSAWFFYSYIKMQLFLLNVRYRQKLVDAYFDLPVVGAVMTSTTICIRQAKMRCAARAYGYGVGRRG